LRQSLMATLSGFFGVLATVLAVIGLYDVISYIVIQRRNEIGVRMALGANRSNILRMMLLDAGTLLAIGLVAGTGLTIAFGSAAASMLYGLKPTDPLTLIAAVAGMVAVGLAASFVPAQRAAKLHPMASLREECAWHVLTDSQGRRRSYRTHFAEYDPRRVLIERGFGDGTRMHIEKPARVQTNVILDCFRKTGCNTDVSLLFWSMCGLAIMHQRSFH
jgi:FtsX-like permease family